MCLGIDTVRTACTTNRYSSDSLYNKSDHERLMWRYKSSDSVVSSPLSLFPLVLSPQFFIPLWCDGIVPVWGSSPWWAPPHLP